MDSLVTLDQAKTQLRLPLDSTEYDDDVTLKMTQATAIVIDYLKDESLTLWGSGSPGSPGTDDDLKYTVIQAAVLEVLWNLFQPGRSNEMIDGPITPRVENMLRRFRDPALA